ncbi:hypothetical protein KCU89_g2407, partial [Aureobasidium melanogenum]
SRSSKSSSVRFISRIGGIVSAQPQEADLPLVQSIVYGFWRAESKTPRNPDPCRYPALPYAVPWPITIDFYTITSENLSTEYAFLTLELYSTLQMLYTNLSDPRNKIIPVIQQRFTPHKSTSSFKRAPSR